MSPPPARSTVRLLALGVLALTLSACLPAPGPADLTVRTVPPASPWTGLDFLTATTVPEGRLLSLPEALARAPLGSVIIACQRKGALWGRCSHLTRKTGTDELTEQPAFLGPGVRFQPLSILLRRDLVIVVDVGVRPEQLPRLRAEAARLQGAPYLLNGDGPGYDCVTYQNALQRALGLPPVAALDGRWNAYLPVGVLERPEHRVLWVGVAAGEVRD